MTKLVLSELRRLVVKIGSTLLVDDDYRIDLDWLQNLGDDIAALRAADCPGLASNNRFSGSFAACAAMTPSVSSVQLLLTTINSHSRSC